MSEVKLIGLTEEKIKRMVALPYELLAKQMSEELGYEITVKTTVIKKTDETAS